MSTHIRTAGEAAATIIREWILSGELAPEATLNQNELAESLEMSRIPIRDALRSLADEGLVVQRAHSTATVAPLSLEDLQELYELRLAIEPRISREALAHVGPPEIDRMRGLLDALVSAEGSRWLDLNQRFHAALYRQSRKPRSIEIIERIRRATDRYTRAYHRMDRAAVHREHELIFESVVAGHGRRLEALVAAHLAEGYETMISYVAEHERGSAKGVPADSTQEAAWGTSGGQSRALQAHLRTGALRSP